MGPSVTGGTMVVAGMIQLHTLYPAVKRKEERHDRTSATSKASLLYDGLSDLCRRTCSLRIDDRRDGARQPTRLLRYNRFARSDRCGPADRQAARSCQAPGIHCC